MTAGLNESKDQGEISSTSICEFAEAGLGHGVGDGNGAEAQGAMFDVKAMAREFYINQRTVWRLVARGEFPPPVRIGRCRRWFAADVVAVKRRLLKERERAKKL